jgi:hypothetical protein
MRSNFFGGSDESSCESKYPGENVYEVLEDGECSFNQSHVIRNGVKDESCCETLISDLPDELMLKIFSYLPWDENSEIKLVNKKFKDYDEDEITMIDRKMKQSGNINPWNVQKELLDKGKLTLKGIRYMNEKYGASLPFVYRIIESAVLDESEKFEIMKWMKREKNVSFISPLLKIAEKGDYENFKLVWENFIDDDYKRNNINDVLVTAARNPKIVEFLLKRKADINFDHGKVLRKNSVSIGTTFEYIKYLVDNGADVNAGNDFPIRNVMTYIGTTGLTAKRTMDMATKNQLLSSIEEYKKIAKFLIDRGANVRVNNDELLSSAAHSGDLEIIQMLVKEGVDVNANNGDALRVASLYGYTNIVEFLLDQNSNVNLNQSYKLALTKGHSEIADMLSERMSKKKRII